MHEPDLFQTAFFIACKAHEDQLDKGGHPYILHPLRVMEQMVTMSEKIVALLHDVVEDSPISIVELRCYGFSRKQLQAVQLLTRDKSNSYRQYMRAIKGNALARQVKMADLKDNLDLARLRQVTSEDLTRMNKYIKALQYLNE